MTLPDKLSDLIELALVCLIKCERSPNYKINMGVWHDPIWGHLPCSVCLAGAVMAQVLGADKGYRFGPSDFEEGFKLSALENSRWGEVDLALSEVPGSRMKTPHGYNRNITHYLDSPGKFKRQLRKLARDLRKDGL